MATTQHFEYILHLADNALILGQRNAEWCGHGPVLEQDIAITNISLDLIGQARMLFQHAAEIYNAMDDAGKASADKLLPRLWKGYGRELQEDDLAFLRDERQYRNLLINELPKGDWATTVLRQFFFSAFQFLQYEKLQQSSDATLAAIAEKSLKEVTYHRRWSAEWVVRLADGTDESRHRIEAALGHLWPYAGEAFVPAAFEADSAAVDPSGLREDWNKKVRDIFEEATLDVPATSWSQDGGKRGNHTEHLGYLLTELQYLQRAYPNMTW